MKANRNTKLHIWQQTRFGLCQKCNKEKDISVDHVIPVNLLVQLGLEDEIYNDEENFEYVCFTCNHFKAGRIDLTNPKTIPLLKKYIDKIK